jgi:hypothetical protein
MLKHILQVVNQLPLPTRWNGGLVHMEGNGKASSDRLEREISLI